MSPIKALGCVFLICFFCSGLRGQVLDWVWAHSIGGSGIEEVAAIVVDSEGNSYITGSFSGTCYFGGPNLISAGQEDVFIAKLSSSGTVLWAKKAGGSGSDRGADLALDADGNLFVVGNYTSPDLSFAPLPSLGNSGLQDFFVVKLDASTGSALWATKAGGLLSDTVSALALDNLGNPIITGQITNGASFGPLLAENLPFYGQDIFLANLSVLGNWLWVKRIMGPGVDCANDLVVDSEQNIYICGASTSSYLLLDYGQAVFTGDGSDSLQGIIVMCTAEGLWQNLACTTGAGSEKFTALTIDYLDNLYLTGSIDSAATFNDIELGSLGDSDIIIAKLTSDLDLLWVETAGGTGADAGEDLIAYQDYLLVTGAFSAISAFGQYILTSHALGTADVFTAMYAYDGECLEAQRAGSSADDYGRAVAVNANGNLFWAGVFTGVVQFGGISLASNGGSRDVYVARQSIALLQPQITSVMIDGDILIGNNEYNIIWQSANITMVYLDWSADAGNTWLPITLDPIPAAPGTYNWVAPQATTDSLCVRVRSVADPGVQSISGVYTLFMLIYIYHPAGGMAYLNSEDVLIQCAIRSFISSCLLHYSIDAGSTWIPITNDPVPAYVLSGAGYPWSLPAITSYTAVLRVSDASNQNYYCTSCQFSILEPIQLQSFNGGGSYLAGSDQLVIWNNLSPGIGTVALDYSLDSGSTWTLMASSLSADLGSFYWELPSVLSYTARVRVRDESNSTVIGSSWQDFAIIYPPQSPQNVQAQLSPAAPYDVCLSWDPVYFDVLQNPITVDNYLVYVCDHPSHDWGDYTLLASIPGTSSGMTDYHALIHYPRRFYRIVAVKS